MNFNMSVIPICSFTMFDFFPTILKDIFLNLLLSIFAFALPLIHAQEKTPLQGLILHMKGLLVLVIISITYTCNLSPITIL